jgi:hypothetical protein
VRFALAASFTHYLPDIIPDNRALDYLIISDIMLGDNGLDNRNYLFSGGKSS